MGKKLYLDCNSGISGDMFVGAMLDLGADEKVLLEGLKSLRVEGFEVKISRVIKSGLDACDFNVVLDFEHENHDHDMEYLYGKHSHCHGETSGHRHEHRGLAEIVKLIEQSNISENSKKTAIRIFTILAESEGKAHGVPVEQVHFHEVGAVDSIVDIVAAAVCLDNLDMEEVLVPKLCEGTGMVRCQHGLLPIPVPATANIIKDYKIRLHITDIEGELVTPTGAAIVAAARTGEVLPEEFKIVKTGLGAGKREYACAGILRAMIID